ncbi:unnamed protein product [Symbiodinium natans]|uniref:Uncharacterized protein n=1 Tax=Symbiodinium natans TaxID=878477 RepID=A0A812LLX0_9DINO|nr:unnamed protein product [Symbiodinium natans]
MAAMMRSWSQEAEYRSFAAGFHATPGPLANPQRLAVLRIPGPSWSKHPWFSSSVEQSQQYSEEVESDSVWESTSSVPEGPLASARMGHSAGFQRLASLQVHLPGTLVPSSDAHLSAIHGHDILEEKLAEILGVPTAAVKLVNCSMHPTP